MQAARVEGEGEYDDVPDVVEPGPADKQDNDDKKLFPEDVNQTQEGENVADSTATVHSTAASSLSMIERLHAGPITPRVTLTREVRVKEATAHTPWYTTTYTRPPPPPTHHHHQHHLGQGQGRGRERRLER